MELKLVTLGVKNTLMSCFLTKIASNCSENGLEGERNEFTCGIGRPLEAPTQQNEKTT